MSDRESFLERWSRRKREAEESAPERAPAAPEDAAAPDESAAATETASSETKESAAQEVDLSALPPIESITGSTDIRAFLNPGIPAPLTRAALRRAWVADPAIRDFVGLAENAWDFNAPDAVPGFGSLVPSEQAQRMISGLLGDNEPVTAPREVREAPEKPEVGAPQESAEAVSGSEPPSCAQASDRAVAVQNDSNVAAENENQAEDSDQKLTHRHGRALPR